MQDDQVTPKGFARYAEQHLGDFSCEVCGTRSWALELDPSIEAGISFNVKPESEEEAKKFVISKTINSCIISCKNCGNIKMFLRDRVIGWLRENPNG